MCFSDSCSIGCSNSFCCVVDLFNRSIDFLDDILYCFRRYSFLLAGFQLRNFSFQRSKFVQNSRVKRLFLFRSQCIVCSAGSINLCFQYFEIGFLGDCSYCRQSVDSIYNRFDICIFTSTIIGVAIIGVAIIWFYIKRAVFLMRFTLFSTAGALSIIIFGVAAIWFYIKRTAFLMSLAIGNSTVTLSIIIFSRLIGSVVAYLFICTDEDSDMSE